MNEADSENDAIEESRSAARRADSVSEHAHDIEIVSAYWEGPIPPPDVMRQFEDVVPGFPERIMRMTEERASHRIQIEAERVQIEKIVVIGESKRAYLGVASAFILSLLMIAIGAYAIIWGNPWVGVAVIGADIAALAAVFIYGTNSRRRERERKAADSDARRDD